MPPRRPSHPPRAPHPHGPPPPSRSSSELGSVASADEIAEILKPWIRDAEDRSFVARCIATEGPTHHRVASSAILRLLSLALEATGASSPVAEVDGAAVRFRLPPHLERHDDEDAHYPIKLSSRALERLAPAGSRELALLAHSLTDGPAHHALANVVMVNMLDALLERSSKKGGE